MSRRITRRFMFQTSFHATALAAAYCVLDDAVHAESLKTPWPSITLIPPAQSGSEKPPVITAVAIHPNGPWVATAGDDHCVHVWDIAEQRLMFTLRGHTDWVQTLEFCPAKPVLASAGTDGRILLWDIRSGQRADDFTSPAGPITRIAWSHDGVLLAVAGFSDRLRIYDPFERSLVRELACPGEDMRSVDFSPDDQHLAAGGRDGIVRVWTTADGQVLRDYNPHQRRIRGLAFSHENAHLVTSGEDRRIHVHSMLPGGEDFHLTGCAAKVLSLAFFGPHHLATGCSDNSIRLWDLRSRSEIGQLRGHSGSVAALASRGSRLVSGSYDATVRIWTIADNIAQETPSEGTPAIRTSRIPK